MRTHIMHERRTMLLIYSANVGERMSLFSISSGTCMTNFNWAQIEMYYDNEKKIGGCFNWIEAGVVFYCNI